MLGPFDFGRLSLVTIVSLDQGSIVRQNQRNILNSYLHKRPYLEDIESDHSEEEPHC